MDRDIALLINDKILSVNVSLQKIVNGINNTETDSRNISPDMKSISDSETSDTNADTK